MWSILVKKLNSDDYCASIYRPLKTSVGGNPQLELMVAFRKSGAPYRYRFRIVDGRVEAARVEKTYLAETQSKFKDLCASNDWEAVLNFLAEVKQQA